MAPMKNEQFLGLERHDGVGLSICIGELYQLREITFRFEMFDNSADLPSRQFCSGTSMTSATVAKMGIDLSIISFASRSTLLGAESLRDSGQPSHYGL